MHDHARHSTRRERLLHGLAIAGVLCSLGLAAFGVMISVYGGSWVRFAWLEMYNGVAHGPSWLPLTLRWWVLERIAGIHPGDVGVLSAGTEIVAGAVLAVTMLGWVFWKNEP